MLYLTLISVYSSAFQEEYFVGLCPSNISVENTVIHTVFNLFL